MRLTAQDLCSADYAVAQAMRRAADADALDLSDPFGDMEAVQ